MSPKSDFFLHLPKVHIEPANSLNYTMRYLDALLKYLATLESRVEVLKCARIVETKKLIPGSYALAFHPSSAHPFDCLDGAKLDLVRYMIRLFFTFDCLDRLIDY